MRIWAFCRVLESIHRPLSSSFLALSYRILNINHKKELLRGLWVEGFYRALLMGPRDVQKKFYKVAMHPFLFGVPAWTLKNGQRRPWLLRETRGAEQCRN